MSILHESQSFSPEFCRRSAIEIFNTYLQCHLAAPDGIRGISRDANGADDDDEIDDTEESDRVRYKEPLATVGALAREALAHSLTVLLQLLESRLSRLHGQIQRLISHGERIIDRPLADLYEDIHWLLLVAGELITFYIIRPSSTVAR